MYWILKGYSGVGNLLLFNNGISTRPGGAHSSVDEIAPALTTRNDYGPPTTWESRKVVWSYKAPVVTDFYGRFVSGPSRLPGGKPVMWVRPKKNQMDLLWFIMWPFFRQKGKIRKRRPCRGLSFGREKKTMDEAIRQLS